MVFLACLIFGGLLLTWWLEEYPWEEGLEIRRMVKESKRNAQKRMCHRKFYGQCGGHPERKENARRIFGFLRNMV